MNDILVKRNGNGPLYFGALLTSYMDSKQMSRTEEGMVLVRKFYEVTETGEKIPVTQFKKGKNYISELEMIIPKNYQNVVLSDEIPAGFSITSGDLSSGQPFTESHPESGAITYFAPLLSAGVYKIDTPLQATLPGTFAHLPASIFPMFDPSITSRTEGGSMQIGE